MTREQAEKLLAALIFDDLDDASKAELQAYLQTDDELRDRLADLRMAAKLTGDAVNDGPAPVLSEERLEKLRQLAGAKVVKLHVSMTRWIVGIAAVLMFGLILAGLMAPKFVGYAKKGRGIKFTGGAASRVALSAGAATREVDGDSSAPHTLDKSLESAPSSGPASPTINDSVSLSSSRLNQNAPGGMGGYSPGVSRDADNYAMGMRGGYGMGGMGGGYPTGPGSFTNGYGMSGGVQNGVVTGPDRSKEAVVAGNEPAVASETWKPALQPQQGASSKTYYWSVDEAGTPQARPPVGTYPQVAGSQPSSAKPVDVASKTEVAELGGVQATRGTGLGWSDGDSASTFSLTTVSNVKNQTPALANAGIPAPQPKQPMPSDARIANSGLGVKPGGGPAMVAASGTTPPPSGAGGRGGMAMGGGAQATDAIRPGPGGFQAGGENRQQFGELPSYGRGGRGEAKDRAVAGTSPLPDSGLKTGQVGLAWRAGKEASADQTQIDIGRQTLLEQNAGKERPDSLQNADEAMIPYSGEVAYPKNWRELTERPTRQPDKPADSAKVPLMGDTPLVGTLLKNESGIKQDQAISFGGGMNRRAGASDSEQPGLAKQSESQKSEATPGAERRTAQPDGNAGDAKLQMNFEDVPLDTVLKYLSDKASMTVVSSGIPMDGRITLKSGQPLNVDESLSLINSVLKEKDLAAVRTGDKTLKIMTIAQAKQQNLPVIHVTRLEDVPDNSDEIITFVIPVRYVDAQALAQNLMSLLPEYATLEANRDGNALIVTDSAASIRRIMKTIQALDTHLATAAEIKVWRVTNAQASTTAQLINNIFQQEAQAARAGGPGGFNPMDMLGGRMGGGRGGATPGAPTQDRSAVAAASDDRTNSVVVRAPAEVLNIIDGMIQQMDKRTTEIADVKVKQLRNADASKVAQVINQTFSQATSSAGRAGTSNAGAKTLGNMGVTAAADAKTNSVVVTGPAGFLTVVDGMVEQLDKGTTGTADVKVYHLQYTDASQIAQLLNQNIARVAGQASVVAGNKLDTATQGSAGAVAAADSRTNSVVVTGPPEMLATIDGIIGQLDKENPKVAADVSPIQPAAQPARTAEEDSGTLPAESRFKVVPVNPWVMTERDALSTFALDVDTASYALCRRYIRSGFLPPIGAVRMEEFVNAFDYAYPQRNDSTFAVYADGAASPFAPAGQDVTLLKIAVKARTVGRDQRKPAHLVFVVDASASMGQPDRLPLVQSALSLLVDKLSDGDRISLITFAKDARLHLEAVSAKQKDTIRQTIDAIQPAGPTNLLAGLRLGYATARKAFVAGQINQVVLCSDGVANVGQTDANDVLQEVAADRKQGITITCVGVGYGAYNDAFLEALADRGDGRYVFLDPSPQAQETLVGQLASTLQTVAKDARIQVQFNPSRVRRYRLIGYENRDIEDKRFRDDTIDAGEVGSGQCSTALYEVELTDASTQDKAADIGTVFVRYRNADTNQMEEISRPLAGSIVRRRSIDEDPRFFLAAGTARFAEWLRQSEHAQNTSPADVQRVLDQVSAALPLDRDVRDLAALAHQAENLPRAP